MSAALDPQQELFTRVKLDLEAAGFAVYDGFLPPEGTAYPFVYLGDMQQIDSENKSAILGTVHQTIHVWSNTPKNRGTVSRMLLDIKTACRAIKRTTSYAWAVRGVSQQIFPDTTTTTPLLHGVLDLEFKFS